MQSDALLAYRNHVRLGIVRLQVQNLLDIGAVPHERASLGRKFNLLWQGNHTIVNLSKGRHTSKQQHKGSQHTSHTIFFKL